MKKIAILFGGWGKERDVSIASKNSTLQALKELGFRTAEIDLPKNLKDLIDIINIENPDVVFNCLHGPIGEDGTVQAILNYLKIPYTHSGLLTSAIAMDKWKSYNIFSANGVPTPKTWLVDLSQKDAKCPTNFPCIAKPVNEGSSFGIQLIKSSDQWQKYLESWEYGTHAIVQEYLDCREIHAAVLGSKPLSTIEIKHSGPGVFDYLSKYTPGHLETICPAQLSAEETELALNTAKKAYEALGCRDLARIDMMFDGKTFFVLEINTQPGFTPASLAPKIANSCGMTFNQLVNEMVQSAQCD
jgi:D-alanine-D-alanine ligase